VGRETGPVQQPAEPDNVRDKCGGVRGGNHDPQLFGGAVRSRRGTG
jgi:hypothetical protein